MTKRVDARKVTIREVAELAGVSIGTASRALNRAGRVSETAIIAVQAAAKRLDYEPDATARSMRTRSTGVVGLTVTELANPHYARIVDAIEARLQSDGYALLLANTHNDPRRERSIIDFFRRGRVDGLILGPCAAERPEVLDTLRAQGLPAIALDRDFHAGGSGVHVDHLNGALQATNYLLNLGHRRIALLTTGETRRPGRERIAGFYKAYTERGLQPDAKLIRVQPSSMDFAFSEALSLLSSPQPPTAFLCLGTRILAGALHGLRHSGLSVPHDVSVISVGDTDLSQLFSPAITSLTWDYKAVGTAVSELMLKRLPTAPGRESVEPERIVIAVQFVLRESCGAIGTAASRPAMRSVAAATVEP